MYHFNFSILLGLKARKALKLYWRLQNGYYQKQTIRGNDLQYGKDGFYKEKLRTYDVDNYRILGKSVEIKVSSKMAGYKMNLPFNAVFLKKGFLLWTNTVIILCKSAVKQNERKGRQYHVKKNRFIYWLYHTRL